MAKRRRLEFLAHEIALTFLGALILSFGILTTQAGGINWLVSVIAIWLGLLIFVLPIVWKIEELL